MMDMSNALLGSGIAFLDYQTYAERIFFPGHQESQLGQDLDVSESCRQSVEQGLISLSNLLNSKLFLTKVSLHSCLWLNLYLCIYFIYAAYICWASPYAVHRHPSVWLHTYHTSWLTVGSILLLLLSNVSFTGVDINEEDFSYTD